MHYLSLDGIRSVLAQPNPTSRNGLRNLTMLSLLYDTGARVQEIVDLTWEDIQFDKLTYIRLTGKGITVSKYFNGSLYSCGMSQYTVIFVLIYGGETI